MGGPIEVVAFADVAAGCSPGGTGIGGIVGISANVTMGGPIDVVACADVAAGCPPGGTGDGDVLNAAIAFENCSKSTIVPFTSQPNFFCCSSVNVVAFHVPMSRSGPSG